MPLVRDDHQQAIAGRSPFVARTSWRRPSCGVGDRAPVVDRYESRCGAVDAT